MLVKSSILGALAAILVASTAVAASAAERLRKEPGVRAQGSCTGLTQTDYRVETNLAATGSFGFVNLKDGEVTFTQGGASAGCVIARFSAETDAPGTGGIDVRLRLGDGTIARPAPVFWTTDHSEGPSVQSFEFVFPNVAPGSRTVRVQWRSEDGRQVFFGYRTLTVTHQ